MRRPSVSCRGVGDIDLSHHRDDDRMHVLRGTGFDPDASTVALVVHGRHNDAGQFEHGRSQGRGASRAVHAGDSELESVEP